MLNHQGINYWFYLSHLCTFFLDFLKYFIFIFITISVVDNIVYHIVSSNNNIIDMNPMMMGADLFAKL